MSNHVMVDIETLGTSQNCVVTSIGAKKLHSKEEFYAKLDWSQQTKRGRIIEPSTIRWWLQQSGEAQAELVDVGDGVELVLNKFSDFCGRDSHCYLWANGSIFDIGILRSLFSMFGVGFPTTYDKEMDFRTLRVLCQLHKPDYEIKWLKDEVAHNALGDAKSQAHALEDILSEVFGAEKPKKKRAASKKAALKTPKAEPKPKKETPKSPEPEQESEEPLTLEMLRGLFKAYAANHGQEKALDIMAGFKITKLSELPEDKYQQAKEKLTDV